MQLPGKCSEAMELRAAVPSVSGFQPGWPAEMESEVDSAQHALNRARFRLRCITLLNLLVHAQWLKCVELSQTSNAYAPCQIPKPRSSYLASGIGDFEISSVARHTGSGSEEISEQIATDFSEHKKSVTKRYKKMEDVEIG